MANKKKNKTIKPNGLDKAVKKILESKAGRAAQAGLFVNNPGTFKASLAAVTTEYKRIAVSQDKLSEDSVKIYVVVAENSTWNDLDGKSKSFRLPCGMAAAQAAHAVSKLKMAYLLENKVDNELLAWKLKNVPITTIVLKARDTKEIRHIADIATMQSLSYEVFVDTNPAIYGSAGIPTAIALGPFNDKRDTLGVVDYLPLWNCPCDPVR